MHAHPSNPAMDMATTVLCSAARGGFPGFLEWPYTCHLVVCKSPADKSQLYATPIVFDPPQAEGWSHSDMNEAQETMPGIG